MSASRPRNVRAGTISVADGPSLFRHRICRTMQDDGLPSARATFSTSSWRPCPYPAPHGTWRKASCSRYSRRSRPCRRRNQRHVRQPSPPVTASMFRAHGISSGDNTEMPAGQMPWVGPSVKFQQLLPLGLLCVGRRGWDCRRRANEAVDHSLQGGGVWYSWRAGHDHDAMSCNPHRINIVHPIVGLAERVVRVATARPVAKCIEVDTQDLQGWICLPNSDVKRLRSMDVESEAHFSKIGSDDLISRQVSTFRRASVLAARRPFISRILGFSASSSCWRCALSIASRAQPIHGDFIVGSAKPGRLARYRRLSRVAISVPSRIHDRTSSEFAIQRV